MELIWQATALMLVILLISAVFLWFRKRKLAGRLYRETGKHAFGHYQNKCVAIGVVAGLILAFYLEAYRFSIFLCATIGVLAGAYLEDIHKDELRPRTSEERKMDNENWVILATLLSAEVVVFMILYIYSQDWPGLG